MPVHQPFGGARKPFTIGMSLLDPEHWIEVDGHLSRYLDEKAGLLADHRDAVFREEMETRDAQAEVLAMLFGHLPARFPDIYRLDHGRIEILPTGQAVELESSAPPLVAAARLVQEDLCLMRDGPGGYRLAAAALCFPSSWSLEEKFGRTLDGLHDNVPGYADGFGPRMGRIFANLKADMPAERFNWSIHAEGDLHHPLPTAWPDTDAAAFLRIERQTLRRLPVSGDILFTIRIYVDPLDAVLGHPEGARHAAALRGDLLGLDGDQLRYKGLDGVRDRLVQRLERTSC
jgi:dimethylamine monooxygenase subunit A